MNCERFTQLIITYLISGHEMLDKLRFEFEEHFISCGNCWDALEAQKIILDITEEDTGKLLLDESIELVKNAETFLSESNKKESINCIEEALNLIKIISEDDSIIKPKETQLLSLDNIKFFRKIFQQYYELSMLDELLDILGNAPQALFKDDFFLVFTATIYYEREKIGEAINLLKKFIKNRPPS